MSVAAVMRGAFRGARPSARAGGSEIVIVTLAARSVSVPLHSPPGCCLLGGGFRAVAGDHPPRRHNLSHVRRIDVKRIMALALVAGLLTFFFTDTATTEKKEGKEGPKA